LVLGENGSITTVIFKMNKKSENKKKILVIGASIKAERYSNKAIRLLDEYGHEVVALAKRKGTVLNIPIQTKFPLNENVHTVTLYVSPVHQLEYYDLLIELKPERVIFNPGTENDELKKKLNAAGIKTIEGCTLVMLRNGFF
jgi:uncharacterized protein